MSLHLVVAGWLLDTGESGANRRLLGLLDAVAQQLRPGERVTVLHRRGAQPELADGLETLPVDIPAGPALHRSWRQSRVLPSLLRDLEATVFELGFLPLNSTLPCPVSLTLHDFRDLGPFARRPKWLARWTTRRALRNAAAVTVPSAFTRSELEREFAGAIPPLVEVIANGVDEVFFDAKSTEDHSDPFCLHVGHLEPRKNLRVLRDAWSRLGPDAPRLVLAGRDLGGSDLATADDDDRILRLGAVSNDELLDLYRRCRAVLMPSKYEGFGLPALEALAFGKPTLVANAGALPEVVGEAGEVLPADDAQAWADAISKIDNTETDAAARRAHARRFTWSHAASQSLQLWRRIGG